MKKIINWRKTTVFDTEADGFLDVASILHVLSYTMVGGKSGDIKGSDTDKVIEFFNYHIKNKIPVVAHSGISYDIPLIEKLLGMDLSELIVIDTLALSWYLNTDRKLHGLDSFLEDYGIAKPKVDDWENLTYEEYRHRCSEDVKINKALWDDLMDRLIDIYEKALEQIQAGNVGGKLLHKGEVTYIDKVKSLDIDEYISELLTFLMFKMDCKRLQERTGWKLDEEGAEKGRVELQAKVQAAAEALESVMPEVVEYKVKKKPAKPYKKTGELSASGKSWNEVLSKLEDKDKLGNPEVIMAEDGESCKLIKGYNPPNIASSSQIKAFLFSHGWKPQSFKYVKDKEKTQIWADSGFKRELKPEPRKIPQISIDGDDGKELCPSVVKLSEDVPEIMAYAKYTTEKSRLDVVKGFQRDVVDGRLTATFGGFTNTLRVQHRVLQNLPGIHKPYGTLIRGSLIADDKSVLLGSDLSSLEDRVKHHFMLPHDPEYVKTMMADDYDPHILTALSAGLINEEELQDFKEGLVTDAIKSARRGGKTTNYASVYGGSPEAIALGGDLPIKTAKALHKGYWELNWSVKAIAEEQIVIKDKRGGLWLINPLNGLCYSLRKDNDRFSTLAQGTGSYLFDIWVSNLLSIMQKRFKKKTLTGCFHDEIILNILDNDKAKGIVGEMVHEALEMVNDKYLLRRKLGCDVQFGYRYSDIH